MSIFSSALLQLSTVVGFTLHQTLTGHTEYVIALATCPDGAFLSGSDDYTIRYWRPSLNGFTLHQTLTGYTDSVTALATCPDGAFLSGSYDKTIRYWIHPLCCLALPSIQDLAAGLSQPMPAPPPVAPHPSRTPQHLHNLH